MDDFLRSWEIGRLYYRLIRGSELEPLGWTAEKLAKELAEKGFIKLLPLEPQENKFTQVKRRYVEMPGKFLTRRDLIKLVKGGVLKLSIFLVVMASVMGCATPNPYRLEKSLGQYEMETPGRNSAPAHKAEADGSMNLYDRYSHQCYSETLTDLWGRPYEYLDCD